MPELNVLLTNLITEKFQKSEYALSLYHPYSHESRESFETEVRSLVLETVRKDSRLSTEAHTHTLIADQIIQELDQIATFKKGVAVFMKFKPSLSNKNYRIDSQKTYALNLSASPQPECTISKTFDLDQLIWINATSTKGLVTDLKTNGVTFYKIDEEGFEQVYEKDNIYLEDLTKKEKEYIEKYAPTPSRTSKGMFYGTGEKNTERKITQANRKLLKDVVNFVKRQRDVEEFSYLVIFHSQAFAALMDVVDKNLEVLSSLTPLTVQKNVATPAELQQEAIKEIQKFQERAKKEALELAKENFQLYREGWNDVTQASHEGKIDTLFINPTLKRTGYLYNGAFLYSHPVEGSDRIKNLGPHLVRNVIQHGGKVFVIDKPKFTVAAKLRY